VKPKRKVTKRERKRENHTVNKQTNEKQNQIWTVWDWRETNERTLCLI